MHVATVWGHSYGVEREKLSADRGGLNKHLYCVHGSQLVDAESRWQGIYVWGG